MTIRKIAGKLHLWLGLAVGLVIFVVCITGAIWAFSPEIENATQYYRHVQKYDKPLLRIDVLKGIAQRQLPTKKLQRLNFMGEGKAAITDFYDSDYYYTVFINPYSGAVLKVKDENHSFFRTVLRGHYQLWLGEVGAQIVKWATLIFFIMLVTGVILWWPRNKAARKQRFKIKIDASLKRLNYDVHNVLGFYAAWVILFAVLTAMAWTFDSISRAEYWLGSGGRATPAYPNPISTGAKQVLAGGIDSVYQLQLSRYPNGVYASAVQFASDDSSALQIVVYPRNSYYEGDYTWYNQYNFKQLPVQSWGKYANANGGEKLSRMNYDIHIGNILGLPGRIAMFLAALVCASLPITGFYIWWGKYKKGNKKQMAKKFATQPTKQTVTQPIK